MRKCKLTFFTLYKHNSTQSSIFGSIQCMVSTINAACISVALHQGKYFCYLLTETIEQGVINHVSTVLRHITCFYHSLIKIMQFSSLYKK